MQEYINTLVLLGISIQDARLIVEHIAHDAYESGYDEGRRDQPAIVGETLGQNGMDFYEWFENQITI